MEPALELSTGRRPGLSAGRRLLACEMGIRGVRLLKDDICEAFNGEPHLLSLLTLVLPVSPWSFRCHLWFGDQPCLRICSASRES